MADYEIIDLREELARAQVQPLTEAELWAQVVAGLISPALYEIRAGRIAQAVIDGKLSNPMAADLMQKLIGDKKGEE